MNRRIAAWTIAAVAVLGLTACSGTPSASDGASDNAGDNAPAEETNTDQSVEDACAIVIPELQEASGALSGIDPTSIEDPQATVDQFNTFVVALGETADKVSNTEVKDATTAVYDNFVSLSEMLSKVLVEEDLEAASELGTVSTSVTESATTL